MKIKFTLLVVSFLFFNSVFCQEDDVSEYIQKFQTAKKKDTTAMSALRADTNFIYKYVSSNRESDAALDLFRFQYRFPENEKADSVSIEFSTFSKTEDDHRPVFLYWFPFEKSKEADKKFNGLDAKITKLATGRSPIVSEGKKTITYRMKRIGDFTPSVNLGQKIIEDADGNKIILVSVLLIN